MTTEEQILSKLGSNHKKQIPLKLSYAEAIYTFRSGIYIINMGEDLEFSDLKENQQLEILNKINKIYEYR